MGRLKRNGPFVEQAAWIPRTVPQRERSGVMRHAPKAPESLPEVEIAAAPAPRATPGECESPSSGAAARGQRCVLFIASRFPPVASIEAIRARKLVKHLVCFGWKAVVLTGAMRKGPVHTQDARRAIDMESLSDLPPNLPIHRLGAVIDHWPTHLTSYLATRLGRATALLGWDAPRWNGVLGWRLRKLHDGLAFPDRGIWRLPSAVRHALTLHRRHRFDAIFTSGAPFSDHLIGLALHTLLRLPWLADFREPCTEYAHWQQWESTWGRRLMQSAEAAVVRRAACVISVSPTATERLVHRYGDPRRKFVTIPNGFDPENVPRCSAPRPGAEFRLLCTGSLDTTRTPACALNAFRRFLDATPGSRNRARFEFAGRAGPFTAELTTAGREGPVDYLGILPHAAALRRMAEADVNVIILPNVPGTGGDSTATVYECLGAGRPILATVPQHSAAAVILRDFDGVWLCEPDDVEAITAAMCELYRRWLADDPPPQRPPRRLVAMTWQHHAEQLANCLNEAVQCRCRRG